MPILTRHKLNVPRRGVVLLAVLVVVALLALAAYQYSDLSMSEYKAGDNARRQVQARALAESGVHYAAAILSNPENITNVLGGNPYHHPTAFANVRVPIDDTKGFPGSFTFLAPPDPDDSSVSVRHGVIDETGKINVNALLGMDKTGQIAHDVLMKLPNMTEEIANSILDWIDADSQPRTGGAEDDYYTGLNPPYRAKNGPLESFDEMLLIKGVTPQLLFGNDRNRNGLLDSGEDAGGATLDRGWSAFLTIYSREQLLDVDGEPLINVNGADLATLHQDLSLAVGEELAKFIIFYRQYGPATNSSKSGGSNSGGGSGRSGGGRTGGGGSKSGASGSAVDAGGKLTAEPSKSSSTGSTGSSGSKSSSGGGASGGNVVGGLDLSKKASKKIASFFELVDSQVSVPNKDPKGAPTIYVSPLKDPATSARLLPLLFGMANVSAKNEIPARVNINTAPREVLAALPDMTDDLVQTIVSLRPKTTSAESPLDMFRTPAWLYNQAAIPLATLKKLDKYLTTRAQVFRIQVVGTLDAAGPAARVEAVIDTNAGQPRILAFRDLSELGKGWNPGK